VIDGTIAAPLAVLISITIAAIIVVQDWQLCDDGRRNTSAPPCKQNLQFDVAFRLRLSSLA
jgi:hypothetical protein